MRNLAKLYCILVTQMILILNGFGQNMVPNPSFEDFTIIAITPPCINKPCCLVAQTTEWKYTNGHVWWPWNPNHVHYFTSAMNFCTDDEWPIPYQGVPVHTWNDPYLTLNGYYLQESNHGNAFINFTAYTHLNYNRRQYPLVELADTLKLGRQYCLSFWLSVPDAWYYSSMNTMGGYFSTEFPVHNTLQVLNVVPQIENIRADYPDTSNTWYLVSGRFIADSNYQYLTIGNFYPDSLTNSIMYSIPTIFTVSMSLYLDNVALYDCTNHNYKCNAGGHKKMCVGESVVLGTDDPPAAEQRQYRWRPAVGLSDSTAAKPLASPTETTTYYLYVIDEFVQESYDTVTVEVIYCDIFIPNIFSPNGDGQNDVLYVRGQGIEQLSFVVYNRWGQKVFETKDPNHGWDGTINGKPAETGVYVYHVNAVLHDGLVVSRHGDVTLVR